jgi:hypothetical protein
LTRAGADSSFLFRSVETFQIRKFGSLTDCGADFLPQSLAPSPLAAGGILQGDGASWQWNTEAQVAQLSLIETFQIMNWRNLLQPVWHCQPLKASRFPQPHRILEFGASLATSSK